MIWFQSTAPLHPNSARDAPVSSTGGAAILATVCCSLVPASALAGVGRYVCEVRRAEIEMFTFIDELFQVASRIRIGFELIKPEETGAISCFPNDCCNHATNVLALHLLDHGVAEEMLIVVGTVPRYNDRHCYLRIRNVHLDITADQFGQKAVIVSNDSLWHDSLFELQTESVCSESLKSKQAASSWLTKILQRTGNF